MAGFDTDGNFDEMKALVEDLRRTEVSLTEIGFDGYKELDGDGDFDGNGDFERDEGFDGNGDFNGDRGFDGDG